MVQYITQLDIKDQSWRLKNKNNKSEFFFELIVWPPLPSERPKLYINHCSF